MPLSQPHHWKVDCIKLSNRWYNMNWLEPRSAGDELSHTSLINALKIPQCRLVDFSWWLLSYPLPHGLVDSLDQACHRNLVVRSISQSDRSLIHRFRVVWLRGLPDITPGGGARGRGPGAGACPNPRPVTPQFGGCWSPGGVDAVVPPEEVFQNAARLAD